MALLGSGQALSTLKRNRVVYGLIAAALCAWALSADGCSLKPRHSRELFQVSTISALMSGAYDGVMPVRELLRHGDFGLGTFDRLDGEMVLFGGTAYQVRADGRSHAIAPGATTPFAAVTFFTEDVRLNPGVPFDLAGLERYLDFELADAGAFYAIRIDGMFSFVKTRSVPQQTPPYRRLVEIVRVQPTFEFRGVRGTIVGFRCPPDAQGMNVAGYHFHFITADKTAGGHVLACEASDVTIAASRMTTVTAFLPPRRLPAPDKMVKTDAAEVQAVER